MLSLTFVHISSTKTPLVNSCGFTQDQLTEACQRAFNDLSSTSVVHVGRPVAPHTDSSPLGPVCPPGSFQAPPLMKPAAFKGFQQPVPSSVISQCGLVGPVLLKASLYVLADAMFFFLLFLLCFSFPFSLFFFPSFELTCCPQAAAHETIYQKSCFEGIFLSFFFKLVSLHL